MRIRICIALLPLIPIIAVAQGQSADPPGVYHVRKLSLVSTDLPLAQRQAIVHAFQGGTYIIDELAERVRAELRESGYELAEVKPSHVSRPRRAQYPCDADVTFAVHAGGQYRLGGITFATNARDADFSPAQLRAQFPLDDGAIFNATVIGKGIENLKDLYGSAGYANFGAIPKPIYDNSRRTISLAIDIDQGFSVTFGKLFLQGTEPSAGVAEQLLASWKEELQGKRYNSQQFKAWLKRGSSLWPANDESPLVENIGPDPGHTLDILLRFN